MSKSWLPNSFQDRVFLHIINFSLDVPVTGNTEIEIAVEAPQEQMLNLDQLDIIGIDGKPLNKRTVISKATLSTYNKNKTENDLEVRTDWSRNNSFSKETSLG